jgi:IS1 family transposase
MNMLKPEKEAQIVALLAEGTSIRTVERITGVHRDTVMRVLIRTGENCAEILDKMMRDVRCEEVEADEIWGYVGRKERRLTPEQKATGEMGDQYVFVAMDRATRLVVSYLVGRRDWTNARIFIADLRRRVVGRIQLTTDAFRPYSDCVERAFGADVDYGQVVKMYEGDASSGRYSPPRLTGIEKATIMGSPDENRMSTSYVERGNLTIRMQIRRFTRLTNAFSRKLANHRAAVAIHFAVYNFCRIHGSLRVTPAMAAGLTDRVWEISDLLRAA